MATWMVQLAGHEYDLTDLGHRLGTSACRIVLNGEDYYLMSSDFDSITDDGEVYERANELVKRANGIARVALGEHRAVELNSVLRVEDDGSRHYFVRARACLTNP